MERAQTIDGKGLKITGKFLKLARLADEYCVAMGEPEEFIKQMRRSGVKADAFTFVQGLHEEAPRFAFPHQERDSMAVLRVTTYDHWLNKQINFKPRNKLRKSQKAGVETKIVEFNDDLVRGIMEVYNESPIRQGKANWHYGKDFDTVKREHATFLELSEFIGAYYKGDLIGFAKLIHSPEYSILINIVAKISERDKAPTNALLAKAIECCAARKIPLLNFGIWGRRGLNDLKVANGFERFEIPRYYVPLTLKGRAALRLKLHRPLKQRMPEKLIVFAADMRTKWNEFRHRSSIPKAGTVALVREQSEA